MTTQVAAADTASRSEPAEAERGTFDQLSPQGGRDLAGVSTARSSVRRMPYPARPRLEPLPRWRGTRNRLRGDELLALKAFVIDSYADGLSLRQIAELTDRTWSDIRAILHTEGIGRRPAGAQRLRPPGQ
jgi:hypothetical protein